LGAFFPVAGALAFDLLETSYSDVRGTAERGPEKVERGRRWSAGKRSAVLNFYPYRTRISSHNLP